MNTPERKAFEKWCGKREAFQSIYPNDIAWVAWQARASFAAPAAQATEAPTITKQVFILAHETARIRAVAAVANAPAGYHIQIKPPTRTLDQNARLWAMLGDVSRQVDWYGKKLDAEDWKHVFSASLRKLAVVPNIDGTGFVALGLSTSRMTKAELGDLMTLIEAFGSERGVEWSEPKVAEPA